VWLFELEELNSTDNLPEMVIEKYAEFKKLKRPVRLFRSDPAFGRINPDYLIIIGKPPEKFEKLYTGWLYNGRHPELSEIDECLVSSDFKFRIVMEFF
jgi:hypothetical protein